jgi:hypothetical protein
MAKTAISTFIGFEAAKTAKDVIVYKNKTENWFITSQTDCQEFFPLILMDTIPFAGEIARTVSSFRFAEPQHPIAHIRLQKTEEFTLCNDRTYRGA